MLARNKSEKLAFVAAAFSQSFGEKNRSKTSCEREKERKEKDPDGYDFKARPQAVEKEKDLASEEEIRKSIKKKKNKLFRNYRRAFNEEQKGKLMLGNQEEEVEDMKD